MDNIRNIISSLYIYNNPTSDNLNMNNFAIRSKPEESLFQEKLEKLEKSNENINSYQINNSKKMTIENVKTNNRQKSPRLDNYNQKYISIKNVNFLKNEINYILKNKELLREQENLMKELKLKKENDALNLLLSQKAKNINGVRSKLYDYEIKQKQQKMKLLKNNKSKNKVRNYSSQKPYRKINNYYSKSNDYDDEYEYELPVNEYKKPKINFTKSVKLPQIQVKPSSSPVLEGVPILHKDYGKMPEYLEKRKKELQFQKEEEIKRQKEKKLPAGYKILTEEERQERLAALKEEERQLEEELYSLPIARLSEKQRKRKEYIEKTLLDNEEKKNKLIGYKEVIIKE